MLEEFSPSTSAAIWWPDFPKAFQWWCEFSYLCFPSFQWGIAGRTRAVPADAAGCRCILRCLWALFVAVFESRFDTYSADPVDYWACTLSFSKFCEPVLMGRNFMGWGKLKSYFYFHYPGTAVHRADLIGMSHSAPRVTFKHLIGFQHSQITFRRTSNSNEAFL